MKENRIKIRLGHWCFPWAKRGDSDFHLGISEGKDLRDIQRCLSHRLGIPTKMQERDLDQRFQHSVIHRS